MARKDTTEKKPIKKKSTKKKSSNKKSGKDYRPSKIRVRLKYKKKK